LHDQVVHLERLYQTYKHRVAFAFVNIHEATHRMKGYEYLLEGQNDITPEGQQFRRRCVQKASHQAKLSMPVFLDQPGDLALSTYGAWPSRLVIVGRDGTIAHDFGVITQSFWDFDQFQAVLDEQCGNPRTELQ
jgi:hypothetical protein